MHGRTCRALPAILWVLAAGLYCSTAVTDVALANPVPESALLIHVHSWDPGFCVSNPITDCSQITQYSEIEGDVEFDLFLADPFGFIPPISSASMTVTWPQSWQFMAFESCSGGLVQTGVAGDQVTVEIQYDSPLAADTLTPIGRFRMQVSGFGTLDFASVAFDGHFWGVVGPAQAGVECAFSYLQCNDLMPPCGAYMEPELLEIHVAPSGTATGTITAGLSWNGGPPCPVQFMEAADWMELDVAWDQYHNWAELTVTVNASGLEPGVYPARIRAVSQIVNCVSVLLYVDPVSDVPGPDPMARATTWGGIKQKYR
jgi:hypothetical protein